MSTRILPAKALNALIADIGNNANKQRTRVQMALVQCAYQAALHRNMDPTIRLFKSDLKGVNRAAMSKWLSLNAPIHFKDDEPKLSDKRQKELTVSAEEFFAEIDKVPAWYDMNPAADRSPNAWDADEYAIKVAEYLENAAKRAEKNSSPELKALFEKARMVIQAEVNKKYEKAEV